MQDLRPSILHQPVVHLLSMPLQLPKLLELYKLFFLRRGNLLQWHKLPYLLSKLPELLVFYVQQMHVWIYS